MLGDVKPEHFPPNREKALIAFAWVVWLHRLVVFLGIAVLVTVTHIDADASHVLGNRMLAAPVGGHILVRDKKGQRIPEQAVYRVSLAVDSPPGSLAGQSWRGQVSIRARWEAPALRYLRHLLAVLAREAGF